jgi:hypothetical protein
VNLTKYMTTWRDRRPEILEDLTKSKPPQDVGREARAKTTD